MVLVPTCKATSRGWPDDTTAPLTVSVADDTASVGVTASVSVAYGTAAV
jgi:hypothetical protein